MSEELDSLESILEKYIPSSELSDVKRILFGKKLRTLNIPQSVQIIGNHHKFDILGFKFDAKQDDLHTPRLVRVGLVQHKIVLPTSASLKDQRDSIFERVSVMVKAASECGVNILCLPEAWMMPFSFCTQDLQPWCQFAESAESGPTTQLVQQWAKQYGMVIISPMVERDEDHGDTMWNTAVVVSSSGQVMGKSRKNHIPKIGDCNEAAFFSDGNTGHRVFQTKFGKIAVNICYGRHHPQNWLMYGVNGAEIVFNPAATEGMFSAEPTWWIEARNAAIANSYFTCGVNRVGTECFQQEFTTGDGTPARNQSGHYFGSSYVAAPDGSRSPGLFRTREGLLVTEMDLNMCQHAREEWGFHLTQRLDLYAYSLQEALKMDYQPPVIH